MQVYKKGYHQCVRNNRPVSLHLLFTIYCNKLISSNQSSFKQGDSCINKLIATAHDIFKGFDDGLEVRDVFLDITKAFDKVGHEGLISKLRRNHIFRNLLQLLKFPR